MIRQCALIIVMFLLLNTAHAQSYSVIREHLIQYEGYSFRPYKDKFGNWTVGVGHRLYFGQYKYEYTVEEIEAFLKTDITIAKSNVERLIPNFYNHPEQIRLLLIGLSFNLGYLGFSRFLNFREAMSRSDYRQASFCLKNSLWARQLPERAESYISILQSF